MSETPEVEADLEKCSVESRFRMLGQQGCYVITVLIGFVTRRVTGWLMIELAGSSNDRSRWTRLLPHGSLGFDRLRRLGDRLWKCLRVEVGRP